MKPTSITVVTPTFRRPQEVADLLENLAAQELRPERVILVDGAPSEEGETEERVRSLEGRMPFDVSYVRGPRGTAVQRNVGVELATTALVALVDDDVRLDPGFLRVVADVLAEPGNRDVGGVVGYRTNMQFDLASRQRWRLYRRLRLLTTFEAGRYDFRVGYPINANMAAPFSGVREVDFMTTACAVWRKEVLDSGLRFDPFFVKFGVLEDAHFSLRAAKNWRLLQCGDATCIELNASGGRSSPQEIGYKSVVNYYFVFRDIAGPLSTTQELRFWTFQAFEFVRLMSSALRRRRSSDLQNLRGRLRGAIEARRLVREALASRDRLAP